MSQVLLVGAGGFIGALLRYALNSAIQRLTHNASFPYGTLVINLSGCLVIGLLAGLIMSGRMSPRLYWREFVFVGILGGFTTFSTFGLDTVTLARTQSMAPAIWNLVGQVVIGLLAVQTGIFLTQR